VPWTEEGNHKQSCTQAGKKMVTVEEEGKALQTEEGNHKESCAQAGKKMVTVEEALQTTVSTQETARRCAGLLSK